LSAHPSFIRPTEDEVPFKLRQSTKHCDHQLTMRSGSICPAIAQRSETGSCLLGGLAEFERHLILSRTNEGRVRAKARGVKFGRKPKLTKHQQVEALARIAHGETLTAIARSYNVSHMTISRIGAGG